MHLRNLKIQTKFGKLELGRFRVSLTAVLLILTSIIERSCS